MLPRKYLLTELTFVPTLFLEFIFFYYFPFYFFLLLS